MAYRFACSIVPHNQGEGFVKFYDVSVLWAEAANALDEQLVDGGHLPTLFDLICCLREKGGKKKLAHLFFLELIGENLEGSLRRARAKTGGRAGDGQSLHREGGLAVEGILAEHQPDERRPFVPVTACSRRRRDQKTQEQRQHVGGGTYSQR
jgi:hypothetical protein